MKLRNILSVVFVSVICFSCATGPSSGQRRARPSVVKSGKDQRAARETRDFRIIHGLFSKGEYEEVLPKMTFFEKRYPQSDYLPQIRNLRGLTYLATKRPLHAIQGFKKALEVSEDTNFKQFVLYNLATAQFEANQVDETQQTLAEIHPESLDRETTIKFHSLRSKLYEQINLPIESAREILSVGRVIQPSDSNKFYNEQLEKYLKTTEDVSLLDSIYRDFEDSLFADTVLYRLGSLQIARGNTSEGQGYLRRLTEKFPNSSYYAYASNLIGSSDNQTVVDSTAVGVLLPLKGKFAKFGTQTLQAIQLAFRIFNVDEPDTKISLILADSGDDANQTLKALEELYFKHHVVAVIGPLHSKGVEPVTQRAEELGLPIITLSQQPGINGDFVFSAGLTHSLQAFELARYAIERMGLKKFAILHPRDKFGEQYSQSYWDAIEALGGEVVGVESYPSGDTDFRQPIDKLSGLYYTEARQRELDELAKLRQENNIKKRNRKTEKYFSLKPIVDYQAVFIPDEPKVAAQIFPTFAYRDIDKMQFFGPAGWHTDELITRAQASAEGAIFVDAFYSRSTSPGVKKFVTKYQSTFGEEPGVLEALGYDAAIILNSVLGNRSRARIEVRDDLKSLNNFPGVTGKISYRAGQLARSLTFLTVRRGQIEEIQAD